MALYLDFHDHIILVEGTQESLIQKLKNEFHFFVSLESVPHFTIDLKQENPDRIPTLVAHKILENAVIYQMGTRQYVDYFGEALTVWDSVDEKITIQTLNEDRLFELAYLAIHSVIGQLLDRKGITRLHALAISIGKVNGVVMLPSKGGKSTLLTHLLENPEVKIISDDMPLVDHEGNIHPFPSKLGLDNIPENGVLSKLTWHKFSRAHYPPKWTASLAELKERIDADSFQNKTILIAGYRLSQGESLMTPVSKWKMIPPLIEHMIVGMGLPQVVELFLKFNFSDLLKMLIHGFIRSFCAFQLLRKSKCYHFYLGPDKAYNAQLLLDTIYEHDHT